MKKPAWVIEKERARREEAQRSIWIFGIHAVRDALLNPKREKRRLVVTRNALERLDGAADAAGVAPELADPRKFPVPLDPGSVHQGAALEVAPLAWGRLDEIAVRGGAASIVVCLDRVTDPRNVGAVLRSAEVFGAAAIVAPARHAAPETGALAKSASGALERQPYLRVPNLARAMETLRDLGFVLIGLAGEAEETLESGLSQARGRPVALVLGAEGPGLRAKTREMCDHLVKIGPDGGFGSLNVSNAAAVALYAAHAAKAEEA